MTRARAVVVTALALLLAAIAVPAASGAAHAHDALVESNPAEGATVTELSEIALTFTADPLDGEGADIIQVVGPDGHFYETSCPSLDGAVVTAPVALGAAGEYRVEWKIVSSDGHPVSDSFAFRYEPAADTPAVMGAADPVCGRRAPAADAAPGAVTAQDDGGLWIGLGIGALVVAGVAVVAVLILRAPRTRE